MIRTENTHEGGRPQKNNELKRVQVYLPRRLVEAADRAAADRGTGNRSEVVRAALEAALRSQPRQARA